MDKEQFRDQYIVSFMATYTANKYDDYCAKGWQWRLSNQPIEDAIDLADKAWKSYSEYMHSEHISKKIK